ncbi:MAG: S-methyl-5-thioribose-1-phosphate isomerase [Gemmatimonadaceae bacterium]
MQSVRWGERGVVIIDQRLLPAQFVERELVTLDEVCDAIRTLAVRGAPAIGITGAMGLVVAAQPQRDATRDDYIDQVRETAETLRQTRPTAVNLPWALARMVRVARETPGDPRQVHARLRAEATAILDEDRAMCQAIGEHGLALIKPGARIATHCNTGALATGGIGTALAPIYLAAERGLKPEVFADETRPLLQGSRLTAWELRHANIPVTILADSAAASLMREKSIDLVIVGADRIAANGDVANKVGTYALAIAARHHGIPFYVAAPSSTVDPATATGAEMHIEQRHADELRFTAGSATAPNDVDVYNPAFDVTPAALIAGIITDRGIHRPPYAFTT